MHSLKRAHSKMNQKMKQTDNIYTTAQPDLSPFSFNEQVTNVFPDMIKRSVPGYDNIISMIGMITDRYAIKNTNLYDLGCSLGAATFAMRRHLSPEQHCTISAIDNSPSMVKSCKELLIAYKSEIPVKVVLDNISNVHLENASIVVLNFTLQFLPKEERQNLLAKIYEALLPGGVLILSEKFCFKEKKTQQFITQLHEDFKRSQGYSELEISQKRAALDNVLVADSIEEHYARLKLTGFTNNSLCYQHLNFGMIISVK